MAEVIKLTIPQIRQEVYRLVDIAIAAYTFDNHGEHMLAMEQIKSLMDETKRRSPVRRSPRKQKHIVTEEKLELAVELAERFPHLSQQDIGQRVGLNAGRVSEALAGKRDGSPVYIQ